MKNPCLSLIVLIAVALLAVPVIAAEANATNTTSTTAVVNTTVATTATTEVPATTGVISATTTTVVNATTTSTPNATATQNATAAATTPLTTLATATPALSESEKTIGEITAASSPLGAALLIDGVYYGTTPVTLNNIPVGNHIVRLTLSGYYDYEGSIYVTPDKVTNVFGTLQPSGSAATVQPTQTTAVITTATVQPTQTTAASIFDNPTVIAAMIGIITACIGAGATIFTHMKK